MRKINYQTAVRLTPLIIFGIILLLGYYTTSKGEGFAIYLTKDDISPVQIPVLSHVDITKQPIININDIILYNANTHEITLTANAFDRISGLEVPVTGKSFVVCIDKNPIYCGAFWTPFSSISFDGVTIWKPLNSQKSKVIRLELGYPSSFFYGGEDPRNNPDIIKSLKQAGKLVTKPSQTAVDKLPNSMKGYEIYSWSENNQWHFTLITGTNRNKTLEEIISTANIISHDGWVHIHVVGVDEIKTVLSRLPHSENILWLSKIRSEQKQQEGIIIKLPEGSTLDTIIEHSEQIGLNLQIQTSS
ncbi:hypothetical protein ACFL0D_08000 [Thermoproteota archaeon]